MEQTSKQTNEQEINFLYIFNTACREKKLIIFTILISCISTIIHSLFIKPTYLGSFDILVKTEKSVNSEVSSNLSSILPGEFKQNDENKTQRLILSSPFVLSPVYDFVQKYKKNNSLESKNLDFNGWKNEYLAVDFEDDTNVLKVNYKDIDKKLILKTLKLISAKYQTYSKSDREKTLNKTINYLESQKEIMKEKSFISKRKLNKFSIDNGLGNIDGFVSLGPSSSPLLNSISVGNISLSQISSSLSSILPDGGSSSTQSNQRYRKQYDLLETYESLYIDLSSKLTQNSKTLKTLKTKIDNLKSSLKRPNEIIIKYQEYVKQSKMDESILDQITQKLEVFKLDKIRTQDPWLMISEPKVYKNKITPKKGMRAIFAFLISSFAGCIAALIKEKKKAYIYEPDEIKRLLGCKYLDTIYLNTPELSSDIITNIFESTKNDFSNNIITKNSLNKNLIFKNLESAKIKIKLLDFEKLNSLEKKSNNIIILKSGDYKHSQLILMNKYISLYKNNFIGWIYIDEKTKFS